MDMAFMDMIFLHFQETSIQKYLKTYSRKIYNVQMRNTQEAVQDFLFYSYLKNFLKVKQIVVLVDLRLLLYFQQVINYGAQTQEILELFQLKKKKVFGMLNHFPLIIKQTILLKKKELKKKEEELILIETLMETLQDRLEFG
ncbi:hypothetical protein IMG5_147040 [Ichthyophthirius multifiliis]|uniref:Uncharacterized protein n=1 Tax=Ichthyophthirius multifiliis TaxID=5932 RepID=G0QY35_ICHMU|nr:hypothetical protein IMG5_147040 [Ichthyophthirius multifiliis]EGR29861.1 hypothetical protein IMG5_147040 [Ichthyophthirius multifiliis]|eukprot:XP_004031097.1 hypothetical protein IMG5_147040 [Ichthyophthirius multifiliis]